MQIGGTSFDPIYLIWITFVKDQQLMPNTKFQNSVSFGFREDDS